ncbi:Bestrophin, RFP-TM, chloride channel-domain-containing protein, partial [Usnea florida]
MSATTTLHNRPSSSALSTNPHEKTPRILMSPGSDTDSPQSTSLRQPSPSPNQRLRPPARRHTSTIDELMTKPLDIERFRKMPYFLRMRGSITPRMIVPLVFVAIWSTIITCICQFWYPLVVSSLLLTVLGFVVGLGISFRTSSAYERYIEGRKYWAQLIQTSRDLARHIWIHIEERHDMNAEDGKADLLAKLSALNLINAFAVALKRRLRFEPYTNYDDLQPLVANLSTFAGAASTDHPIEEPPPSIWKAIGNYLGLEFTESNPRKHIKRADKDGKKLGNLPLEILHYLSAYVESCIANGTLPNGTHQGSIMANLASLNETLAGTERVVNTPLPLAYSIAISQITWTYVLALPFQLWDSLHWVTIPGTVVGAYIILGIAAIGREIEDPFGYD